MKLQWMYGALLAAAMVTPGSAQVSVYIGTPPPAVVYEEPGPPSGAGLFGSRGYWQPVGHRYRGHWDREDHDNHHWRDHDRGRGNGDHGDHGHEHRE